MQETYLHDELNSLKQKESRLVEITAEYEEILDSLSEEEKESEVVNDAKDSFVNAAISKEVRQIKSNSRKSVAFAEDSYESKILKVSELLDEEKELKTQVKTEAILLHLLTKSTIENLSDAQVFELLELKWITPLVTSLNKLPEVMIKTLTAKVQALAEKYAVTYEAVVNEIHETESSLSSLIDELDANEYDLKGLSEFKSLLKGI